MSVRCPCLRAGRVQAWCRSDGSERGFQVEDGPAVHGLGGIEVELQRLARIAGQGQETHARALAAFGRVIAQRLAAGRSEEHTSELQSHLNLVCRLLLEKKKNASR